MEISVSGKHVDVGDAFRGYAEDQLTDSVKKYFDQAIDAQVTVSREGSMMHVEISVHPGPRGFVVQGSGQAAEAYPAFDIALERIAKQLRRYKRRLVGDKRHRTASDDVVLAQQYVIQGDSSDTEVAEDAQPIIVAEMQTNIATLTVSQAVMHMDLADLPLLMFRNAQTNTMSVVYHRKDGNIGWIDPTPSGIKD
ncbi:MAG: ribosome-associated translation inhibitor RaiA [Rhodospirillales bacterium]|jgi:ribosomal subunit interface protein|nr:ribosome-associated translation inhibitor RaiA [Rhodospirillales bacterium]